MPTKKLTRDDVTTHRHHWLVPHMQWEGDWVARYCRCGMIQAGKVTRWRKPPRSHVDLMMCCRENIARAENARRKGS